MFKELIGILSLEKRTQNAITTEDASHFPGLMDGQKPWLYLAPMAGITDWAFREICYQLGAEVAVVPLVPALGLANKPKRVLPKLVATHDARRLVVQLYGKYPDDFRRAARALTDSTPIVGIDINMGCPANQVVGSNHGSALMREPERAAAIVEATRAGTHLPVSVKLRAGWDSVVAPDFARLLESAGASLLTIHGRTREQHYKGSNCLDVIAETKRAVSIPVIGNGDVVSVETARQMLEHTGVDGIMIGRGAMGNPWLFAQIQAQIKGENGFVQTAESRASLVREHARLAFLAEGYHAALTIRKHLIAYSRGHSHSAPLRRQVEHLQSREDVEEWINRWEALPLEESANPAGDNSLYPACA
jgi:tRNA-dihydrouridine synthase B